MRPIVKRFEESWHVSKAAEVPDGHIKKMGGTFMSQSSFI
jgi:hypothetical protein